ncbi:hypothetical protein BG006_001041 [Podila minutissima]|uniref:F-box protein n=1 Tax=Podila minutissima TaxID=64525 RepID=A0A9P5SE86_9FUNG|nr:hypothetical protein BG006_001041 [Podila minutissima]
MQSLMALIAACQKLEVLHVGFLNNTDGGKNNTLLPVIRGLQHLRELHIHIENSDPIDSRHRIVLPKMHDDGARNVAAILKATATRLRHLDLHASASNGVLIRAITGLETFICSRRPQEPQLVVDALLEHRHTLRVLVFETTDMGGMTGVMFLSLLKDCPHLESFSALSAPVRGKNVIRYVYQGPAVRASDFEASGGSDIPWTCERLKVLKLQFASRVGITPDQLKPDGKVPHYLDKVVRHLLEVVPLALIAQMGRLTQLEELREDAGIDERQRQLEMQHRENVSKLLRVLSTLKNLKRLELRGLKEFIDTSELKGARKHWKQLEWVAYS